MREENIATPASIRADKLPVSYGVWIPGMGWLKSNGQPYADLRKEVALSTARRVKRGARVEFIDASLVALQDVFLEVEYDTWSFRTGLVFQRIFALFHKVGEKWHIFKK